MSAPSKPLLRGPKRGRQRNRSKWHFLLPRSRSPAYAQLNAALADGSPGEALPRRPTCRSGRTKAQVSTAAPTRCSPHALVWDSPSSRYYPVQNGGLSPRELH